MTVKGYDVSNYQSSTYSVEGIDFVVVKATEGTSYLNPKHSAQVARGRDNGLVVGHYHFVSATSSMHAQVDYFLSKAGAQDDEFLVLDWENSGVSCDEKDDFLRYLKSKAGTRRVLLYCNVDYWLHRDTDSYCADGLWIAQYNGHPGAPSIEHAWLIHQYTSTPIDTNLANFASRQAMATWAGADEVEEKVLPTVSLSRLIEAAQKDPKAAQGHKTYEAGTKLAEQALLKLKYMASKYAKDGSFGSTTVTGYGAFQKAYSKAHGLGWTGSDVNGIPGKTSLTALGKQSGLFKVGK